MRPRPRAHTCWNCEQPFTGPLGVVFCSPACGSAFREEAERWLAARAELRAKQRAARQAVADALKKGGAGLPKKRCLMVLAGDCDGDLDAHHRDYDKPLEIVWLCRRHHAREHQPTTARQIRYRSVVAGVNRNETATHPDTKRATRNAGRPSRSLSVTYNQ